MSVTVLSLHNQRLTSPYIEREPFVATFKVAEGHFDFTLISIHVLWGNSVVTRRQELTHFSEVRLTLSSISFCHLALFCCMAAHGVFGLGDQGGGRTE